MPEVSACVFHFKLVSPDVSFSMNPQLLCPEDEVESLALSLAGCKQPYPLFYRGKAGNVSLCACQEGLTPRRLHCLPGGTCSHPSGMWLWLFQRQNKQSFQA